MMTLVWYLPDRKTRFNCDGMEESLRLVKYALRSTYPGILFDLLNHRWERTKVSWIEETEYIR